MTTKGRDVTNLCKIGHMDINLVLFIPATSAFSVFDIMVGTKTGSIFQDRD